MSLGPLIWKEARELLRDRYVLVQVLVLPFAIMVGLGLLFSAALGSVEEAAGEGLQAALVLEDPGDPYASQAASLLGWPVYGSLEEALANARVAVYVPRGFSEALEAGEPGRIVVYASAGEPSLLLSTLASSALEAFASTVRLLILERHGVPPGLAGSPVEADQVFLVGGEEFSPGDLAFSAGLPLAVGFLAFLAGSAIAQVAALSVGWEREYGTLEALLAMPVSRLGLAIAKLAAAALVGVLGGLSFAAGLAFYMAVLLSAADAEGGGEGGLLGQLAAELAGRLREEPLAAVVVAAAVLAGLVNMAVAGLLLSAAFAASMRGAVIAANAVTLASMAPIVYEVAALGAEPPLAVKAAFHLSPIYYPYAIAKAYASGSPAGLAAYAALEVAYIALLAWATARLMRSEALLYGLRTVAPLARGRRTARP